MQPAVSEPEAHARFGQAYPAYRGMIHTFSRNAVYAVTGYAVEDIEQELAMVLLKCCRNYDPDRSSAKFSTLFQGCAKNHIISLIRKCNTKGRKAVLVPLETEEVDYAIDRALADWSAEDWAMAYEAVAERAARGRVAA